MRIIKLGATDSTNRYLKEVMKSETLPDYTVVVANAQTKGRGQMGTKWESEPGKNLTFSILKKAIPSQETSPFLLNMCVSLAVYKVLKKVNVPDLSVKWPNDILSGNRKICGILIENILSGHRMQASVIGIGLNVNQTQFANLPRVSSLQLLLGTTFDLNELLELFQAEIKAIFMNLDRMDPNCVQIDYEKVLFRKDKPSTFKDQNKNLIMGFIRGVSKDGKLVVTLEDDIRKAYSMKEISLLY